MELKKQLAVALLTPKAKYITAAYVIYYYLQIKLFLLLISRDEVMILIVLRSKLVLLQLRY